MKKFILVATFILFMFGFSSATTSLINETINGKKVQVMKVELDGKSKIVVSAVDNYNPAKSLKSLMDSVGGIHAINGGFFCPNEKAYSWCEGNTTDQLRISNGKLMSRWQTDIADGQAVFGFDTEGNSNMVLGRPGPGWFWDQSIPQRNHPGLSNIHDGIMMYSLVSNGINIAVNNKKMNSDPKQGKAGNKTFICSTKDKSTIYMGYVEGVTFSALADYIIKTFACYDAIQLDNGGTKAMIFNDKYIAGPGRNMMDAFIILEEKGVSSPEINDLPKLQTNTNSITNDYQVSSKIKSRVDLVMSVIEKQWGQKYSLDEQRNKYRQVVNSFSRFKFQGEQKETIDYLLYLFNLKLKTLD
ncbi:MAG TPA: phosphodiester glycosidase family protein [Candidatus Absconditabacterales bacterium]|nr:phosphodiester glycosidase family protein [Candidatus Absconditabacterales bacterium]HRU50256.1 phosphodiester glycosidase family protein [Candidatus Absconditabacterales bacterium]